MRRGIQRSQKLAEEYRTMSMEYASGVVPIIKHTQPWHLFECQSCHSHMTLKKFPKSGGGICKKCIRKNNKIKKTEWRISSKVSPAKVRFAAKLKRNMTPAETHLWAKLQKLSPVFNCQTIIFGYIADFICVRCKLIVEIDGPIHDERKEYDAERDQNLKRRGFRTMRFTNEETLTNRQAVLGKIIESL